MKELTVIDYCINRDGKICGICKQSIEEELKKYSEYAKMQKEIRRQKRILQQKVIEFRKYISINIDHIVPKSKDGKNDIDNYQVTHIECNTKKGNFYEHNQ